MSLLKKGSASMKSPSGIVSVKMENNIPYAVNVATGESLPGYFSFWFSWYAMHNKDGYVWDPK